MLLRMLMTFSTSTWREENYDSDIEALISLWYGEPSLWNNTLLVYSRPNVDERKAALRRMSQPGVEQAMKNWEGEKFLAQSARNFFAAAPIIPVCPPPLTGGTCPFCPSVEAMHAVTINQSKSDSNKV